MRYWKITADYRPNNSHKPQYKIKTKDNATIRKIKEWWNDTYSWLKIYDIQEICEAEYLMGHNQLK